MTKVSCVFVFCLMWIAFGQMPSLSSSSPKVKISLMALTVNVTSNRASVNCEIHFKNDGQREAEAQLTFPLPEGVGVSRYFLDVNGAMREAVPINKDKGKQVFEALQQRKVDPGLLEKTEVGNSFRTRIYPVPVGGTRKIIIGYEQELDNADGYYIYKVLSEYDKKIDSYNLNINVVSEAHPQLQSDDGEEIELKLDSTVYRYAMKKDNYKPKNTLTVKIPAQKAVTLTKKEGDTIFFYTVIDTSAMIRTAELVQTIPSEITLLWDDSLSLQHRNLGEELKLLDKYFNKQNTKVTLYFIDYTLTRVADYEVTGGNWDALRKVLEKCKYDGGTRYNQIQLDHPTTVLFFTDGISSLSNATLQLPSGSIVHAISSTGTADHAYLNHLTTTYSGIYVNLKSLTADQGAHLLSTKSIRFQGVEQNVFANEVYPLKGTLLSKNSFSVSGRVLKDSTDVVLLFGSTPDNIVKRIPLTISAQNTLTNIIDIEKIWAIRKIESLEYDYTKNKEEIELLGRKHSIVTRGTSLIVLEDVADYIKYGVTPPKELREEFDRLSKAQLQSSLSTKINNWNNIDGILAQLRSWWKGEKKTTGSGATMATGGAGGFIRNASERLQSQREFSSVSQGTVRRMEEQAEEFSERPHARMMSKRARAEVSDQRSTGKLPLRREATAGIASSRPSPNAAQITAKISGDSDSKSESKEDSSGGEQPGRKKDEEKGKSKNEFSGRRPYLSSLEEASDKYKAYLELRTLNENNPTFYIDVAMYMFSRDPTTALKVLSTIAELSLENHYLYKTLTYLFKQFGSKEDCLFTAQKVAAWRSFEPQSHRDLALAYELNDRFTDAAASLVTALQCGFYPEMSRLYSGIEEVILLDIDRMAADHGASLFEGKLDSKYYDKRMPLDLRIVLNWNMMDVDIDLHVIEPNGQECYFAHKQTDIGGRYFKDFTAGYGPEMYALRKVVRGAYQIKTNLFGERQLTDAGPITVHAEVYERGSDGKTTIKYRTVTAFQLKEKVEIDTIHVN